MSSVPDSERAITFGSFSLLGIALRPCLLLTKLARWRGGSGAWLPFSIFLFLWGRCHSEDTEKGAGLGLPVGLFLFQLEELPCLRTGGSGNGCRVLQACPFFGTATLFPSETLLFPSYAPWYRLRRSGCACLGLQPYGKFLRLCLQKVP